MVRVKTPDLIQELVHMEARSTAIAYKIGVLYVKPHQQEENQIFSNCTLSF